MITWCDNHTGFLSAVLTLALVLITAKYVLLTRQTLFEMRAQRSERFDIYLDVWQAQDVVEPFLAALLLLGCRNSVGIAFVSMEWGVGQAGGSIPFRDLSKRRTSIVLDLEGPSAYVAAEPHSLNSIDEALRATDLRLVVRASSNPGVALEPVSRGDVRNWAERWQCVLREYCRAHAIGPADDYMAKWWIAKCTTQEADSSLRSE